MKSVARFHFPRIIIENNEKWLFNPILKKRFKNRPEERVRLQWVEYLMRETRVKPSRIGFETPVELRQATNALRADLLIYDKNLSADVLIECKSDRVSINESVARQAARYNSKLKASKVVLTNGVEDFMYKMKGQKPIEAINFFDIADNDDRADISYWNTRGFCSANPDAVFGSWFSEMMKVFWQPQSAEEKRYLAFDETVLPIPMDHYYQLFSLKGERKIAVTFLGYGSSDTYLLAVLNKKGQNTGILAINLIEMFQNGEASARVFSKGEITVLDAATFLPFTFSKADEPRIKKLAKHVMNFFD